MIKKGDKVEYEKYFRSAYGTYLDKEIGTVTEVKETGVVIDGKYNRFFSNVKEVKSE